MKNKLILVGLTLLLFSCSKNKKTELEELKKENVALTQRIKELEEEIGIENPENNTSTERIKNLEVTSLDIQSFKHFIEIQGKVDASENISISSKMPGFIEKILVKEGNKVSKGQTLAEMDNDILEQSIEEVKSSLAFSTNLYLKQKNLWEQKIGTEIQFLTAKNNKESLEQRLATLNEQNNSSMIKSPINGTVDAIDIKIGQSVIPGMPTIRVVNFTDLKVKGEVAEAYASKVRKGNEVIIYFPDLQKEITSTITHSARVISNLSRSFMVECKLPGDHLDYSPNMIAILKIIDYENDSAIVVPVNVIQNSEEGKHLFIAAKEKGKKVARKKNVTVGATYKGKTEITSGLNKGDLLISTGYQDLNDGDLIKY